MDSRHSKFTPESNKRGGVDTTAYFWVVIRHKIDYIGNHYLVIQL